MNEFGGRGVSERERERERGSSVGECQRGFEWGESMERKKGAREQTYFVVVANIIYWRGVSLVGKGEGKKNKTNKTNKTKKRKRKRKRKRKKTKRKPVEPFFCWGQ